MVSPVIPIALAVGFALGGVFVAWSYSSPREYLKHVPQESLLSPLGLICYSHEKLAQLQPSPPDKAVTLFSVLRLDHTQLPFYPADDCAYPYSPNYYLAKAAISNAWLEITDAHDGSMVMWRDVFAAAAATLLNDTSRVVYMKEILPKMEATKGDAERVWRDICA
ncbi:hypothetical protein FALBO_258 [Fusarium albosuccineum]|uniref:Uncharacterized protein n=1 Tax=Fusarium albosuccineum TaxID=1237068 RepID=A0A8H4LR56_9HYPO|nr:hypothetical protein FALBO_258 [Fusarium albosuccineum]